MSVRAKKNRIRILAGDGFTLRMISYDLSKGRIDFRRKDERAAVPGAAAWRSFRRPSTRAAPMPPKCPKARRAG
jgi:translation initiation factor IF-1